VNTVCTSTSTPPGIAPDYPSPGGGPSPKGKDGDAADNLCPHPTIQGIYIDCDVCIEDGYEKDADGNCVKVIAEDFDDIDLNIDNDPYKKLTRCEKDLIKEGNVTEAFAVEENRIKTIAKTDELFGNGRNLNNCGDAFRHAYFSALNAQSLGIDLARRFGIAHECETPRQLSLEKEMDLHNNEIGFSIILEFPEISEFALAMAIWVKLESGEMTYLSPINKEDPCFDPTVDCSFITHGINENTQLIPSNADCL
ncbi:MAG: hypothetical protein WBA74_04285, partial [Cyclobacteriaceae bacterium]